MSRHSAYSFDKIGRWKVTISIRENRSPIYAPNSVTPATPELLNSCRYNPMLTSSLT
jgi:hypothetical protein